MRTLNREIPGSNLLAMAEMPLVKELYLQCLHLGKEFEAVGPPGCLLVLKQFAFLLLARLNKSKYTTNVVSDLLALNW